MDKPFPSLAQTPSLLLLHDSTPFSLTFSQIVSSQILLSICETFPAPTFLLPPLILLSLLLHPKSPTLPLLSSLPSSFLFSVSFSCLSLLVSSLLLPLLLPPSAFSILIFPALVSTVSHIPLDTSSFSPLLFSNLSLGCGVLTMASLISLSTSVHLSH